MSLVKVIWTIFLNFRSISRVFVCVCVCVCSMSFLQAGKPSQTEKQSAQAKMWVNFNF